jgi:hypothetical protein
LKSPITRGGTVCRLLREKGERRAAAPRQLALARERRGDDRFVLRGRRSRKVRAQRFQRRGRRSARVRGDPDDGDRRNDERRDEEADGDPQPALHRARSSRTLAPSARFRNTGRARALRPELLAERAVVGQLRGALCATVEEVLSAAPATSGAEASQIAVSAPRSALRKNARRREPSAKSHPPPRPKPVRTTPGWSELAVTPEPASRAREPR